MFNQLVYKVELTRINTDIISLSLSLSLLNLTWNHENNYAISVWDMFIVSAGMPSLS